MKRPETAAFSRLIDPEIILHNAGKLCYAVYANGAASPHDLLLVCVAGEDGTLRAAATKAGVPAICVEMGDPQLFEYTYIRYLDCLVLSLHLSPQ